MLKDLRYQTIFRDKDELLDHLHKFRLEPRFSAGIWYFSPAASRFHEKYRPEKTIEERLQIIYRMFDEGYIDNSFRIEAHYPNEINWDNIDLYKDLDKETGIKVLTVIPNLFYDRDFEFGSLSNPYNEIRRKAIDRLIESLRMNRELDTNFAVIWPGIDGYENPFEVNFYRMWDLFEKGVAEAMDEIPGVRIALEPKPFEPRGNNIYRHTANGIIMAERVESLLKNEENRRILEEGHHLVTLNVEFGHALMGYEDFPYTLASVMREGRLAHLHLNSNPVCNYDQDLNVGVLGWQQMYAGFFVLKMYGYREYFGIDINPVRIPVDKALILNMKAIKVICDRINSLDYDKIVEAIYDPANNRGVVEDILLKSFTMKT